MHLEITDTTYCSTIFNSNVFSLYSHLCIYLHSYQSTHSIPRLAAGGASEQFEVQLKMTIWWTERYTPRPSPSVLGDALAGREVVNSQMHSDNVIERLWSYSWRTWLRQFEDAYVGHDHTILATVIIPVWRYSWLPWYSKVRDTLRGCDQASVELHLETKIE